MKQKETATAKVKALHLGNVDLESGDATGSRSPHVLHELRVGTTKSLNAALIEQLRADLLRGVIAPDVKLKIPDICARYGVSPGVAREALSRLVPEGLIDSTDQRGFRTPPLTAAVVRDITRMRMLIEQEALIDAMRHGTDEWEAGIVAAQHRLQSTEKNANGNFAESDEFSQRHRDFHRALIAASTSPWLIRLHNMLYDQTERYRLMAARDGNRATGQKRNISHEHSEIADAVIARDEAAALHLMETHLQRTADRALAGAAFSDKTAESQ